MLSDSANASIPNDIREQLHRDENGRVLFFTSPPLDVLAPAKPGAAIGHSVQFMADKLRRAEMLKEKRKREEVTRLMVDAENKRTKVEEGATMAKDVQNLMDRSLMLLTTQMADATTQLYKDMYGDRWEEGRDFELKKLEKLQADQKRKNKELEEFERKVKERETISLKRGGVFLDDVDPRY